MVHEQDSPTAAVRPQATFAPRREPRLIQRRREITVRAGTIETPLVLKNISCRGASGVVGTPLPDHAAVTLLFEGGRSIAGQIRWSRGNEIGVELASPLPLAVLAGPPPTHATRERRFAVRRPVAIMLNGLERAAVIRNVSTRGMLIETVLGLSPGQAIEVVCGTALRVAAQVRWASNGRAGLQLAVPLDLAAFDEATSG
jgi:hypothetical protein